MVLSAEISPLFSLLNRKNKKRAVKVIRERHLLCWLGAVNYTQKRVHRKALNWTHQLPSFDLIRNNLNAHMVANREAPLVAET